jgi:hypothetical protein
MSEEHDYHIDHPIVSYCFAIMEYIRDINPELYKKAVQYAEDLTGVVITDFSLEAKEPDEKYDNDISEEIDDNGPYGKDYNPIDEDEEEGGDFYNDDQYYG